MPELDDFDNSDGVKVADFDVEETLGKGKHSEVFRARHKSTGQTVALKRIHIFDIMDSKQRADCLNEAKLLQSLNHPNIVSVLQAWVEENDVLMALECCEQGDLASVLEAHKTNGTAPTEREIWMWFAQVANAVACMHRHRVMHRDIKPGNIFITGSGSVKIGDLGLSRYLSSQTVQVQSMVGTPCYMSPEVIRGLPYEFSSDVWGLGCLLYEMAALRNPFVGPKLNYYTLGKKIASCQYDPLPESAPESVREMVGLLLRADPAERPSVEQILERIESLTK
ncbi:unnamed protein product [Pedinophyceae sp. YPF-701]|nr:unnamed protein product [Pedinophyceae sp. YPF-701]